MGHRRQYRHGLDTDYSNLHDPRRGSLSDSAGVNFSLTVKNIT
jgi:hypothetical protein